MDSLAQTDIAPCDQPTEQVWLPQAPDLLLQCRLSLSMSKDEHIGQLLASGLATDEITASWVSLHSSLSIHFHVTGKQVPEPGIHSLWQAGTQ